MLLVAAKCLGGCMWALPVLTFGWIVSSCFVTYGIAVAYNHTFPDFPYISYTGIKPPEQGIFTITIAIGAVFLAANAEMQYLFIKKLFNEYSPEKKWRNINRAGLSLGMISGLGLLFVACFQVDTMKPPHYAGAFMCFGFAMGYAWVQVGITWKIRHFDVIKQQSRRTEFFVTQICQIVNSVMSTVLFFTFAVSKTMYNKGRDAGLGTKWDTLRPIFLVSTISEWLLTISVTLFLLTFIPAFRMFSHTRIEIDFISPHLANGDAPAENGNGQHEGIELMTST
ncbi:DNA damage-regulated autophagy modulator protein 2-like [Mizuhopecten yessoensis]|uniref:DNA damage-regulated autophagy modulator protein 2 n=1 Tax=Mizuhopecten yessoensis TaxID=6573 RepID=A0A210QTD7_MIZYE|nr:DNA damage-regulated autophagy modulator protein 2-like [Mizuhopecten yessoensis]XP_021350391.1 DNA damage-regulated autophagy modulator protein 2-like [Mizuhopecten yessoensis]XP_021350392.1 DNA damage-regulated autophagy modulator protein 2-like [Mizuhopecten yessoensis]XP_021350393.1 DNA damage-regulated autophagy modulator protein 2-like [Mizuhopecten yessoensis]XP_021350394.1 DNA damage-regulated autophagy modulator protein 2-like [Mizuhopecten yessoensis]XP_021350395.1 DNA damage-regu